MSYSGPRLFNHLSEAGQRGGVANQPYSAVISGFRFAVDSITATLCDLTVQVGEARVDGTLVRLAAPADFKINGSGFNLATPQEFTVYLNPKRQVPALQTPPPSPTNGMRYVKVVPASDGYYVFEAAYKYNGNLSQWEEINVASEPASYSHNNMPLNDIYSEVDDTWFSLSPEKDIYLPSGYPVHVSGTGSAYFRRSASIPLVKVTVANSAATFNYLTDYQRSYV